MHYKSTCAVDYAEAYNTNGKIIKRSPIAGYISIVFDSSDFDIDLFNQKAKEIEKILDTQEIKPANEISKLDMQYLVNKIDAEFMESLKSKFITVIVNNDWRIPAKEENIFHE